MKYKMNYFGKEYEVENVGDGAVLINGEPHYCKLRGDLEYGCKECGYSGEYMYNPETCKCEEL